MKPLAKRMENLESQFFASLGAKIRAMTEAGCDIIRLDVGSPDLPPALHVLDALHQALTRPDVHGYQPHEGTTALRTAWAGRYQVDHGVELDPDREVVPLLGSKEGIFHLMMALVEEGDVVLIPDPGYLTYTQGTHFAGGEPYYIPLLPENDFLPDLDAIPEEIARRAKILWMNYPNNPTGAIAGLDFFEGAVRFAHRYDILLCHDAAYSHVSFDGYRPASLLEVPGSKEVAVEFNTLSKTYNMAGWRVGVAVGASQPLRALYTLKTHLDSGHFLPVLTAAAEALAGDQAWLLERNQVYQERRDLLWEGLRRIGLEAAKPSASLYLWVRIPSGWTSVEFASHVLDAAHISLTPGTVFGKGGEGYVRLSLTTPTERIALAVRRLEAVQTGLARSANRSRVEP